MYKTNLNKHVGFYLAIVLLMLLVTACGGGQNAQSGSKEGIASEAEPQEITETQTEVTPQSPEPDSAIAAEEIRSYTHDFGTIEVPDSPHRIVGVYLDDFLLALGVKPLTQTLYGQRPLPYLQDQVGDLPAISPGSINLELILEEDPDLIMLAYPFYAEEGRYELFSEIAPTYVFSGEEGWRQTLHTVAEIIGKPEAAKSWLDDYERKVADAREVLKAEIGDETVMFVRFTRLNRIQLYGGPSNFSADVLYQGLGLQPSALVKELAWDEENSAPVISAEIIPQFDADHIFITYDNPANEDVQEFKNNPLWKNVPAVKNGNVYEVEMFHWMNDGPIAYNRKVDDVLGALRK